jgi:VWFA-related protein
MRRFVVVLLAVATQLLGGSGPSKEALAAYNAGARAARQNDKVKACLDFQRAVELYPDYYQAWLALGRVQMLQNEEAKARASLETAIRINPRYTEAHLPLAALELGAQRWQDLADVTDRLLSMAPDDYPQAWLFNAIARLNLKQADKAEASARRALQLDPQNRFPSIRHLLGTILFQRGDTAGAIEHFRKYLELAPDSADSDAVREKLKELQNKGETAQPQPTSATFRAEANLALVRFQYKPAKERLKADLQPSDIEILEDGKPQTVALFQGGRLYPRTVPVQITLLFDCSGSVRNSGQLEPDVFGVNILREFENASIAIYGFGDTYARFTPPTRDEATLRGAINAVRAFDAGGPTAVFRWTAETISRMGNDSGNAIRMLVVISDGWANARGDLGRANLAVAAAKEAGVAIFPVLLRPHAISDVSSPMDATDAMQDNFKSLEEVAGRNLFLEMATATGGRKFDRNSRENVLPELLRQIAAHLQYEYVAGFYPPATSGRKQHNVKVVLRSKELGSIEGGARVVLH